MTSHLRELLTITRDLPEDKAEELVDFARFLRQQAKSSGKRKKKRAPKIDGDAEWERILNDPKPRSKFAKLLRSVDAEIRKGKAEPMDFKRL
jgi:hypothetical protein